MSTSRTLLLSALFLFFAQTSYADIFVVSKQKVNVRSEATTRSPIIQKTHKDDWFILLGNSADEKWRKVELPGGRSGWIFHALGTVEDDNYFDTLSDTPTDLIRTPSVFDITRLEIHIINVRQGDSTLIVAYGSDNQKAAILFDGGKPGRGDAFVVPYLKSIGISEITYIISSHHDSDHTGGLDEVLTFDPQDPNDFEIKLTGKAFVTKAEVKSSQKKQYDEYVAAVVMKTGEPVSVLSPPAMLPLANGITIQVVTGGGAYLDKATNNLINLEVKDANAKSIGLLLTFGKFTFFVAGDLGGQSKHKFIENKVAPFIGNIDVLRVSHHGSDTSTDEPFLSIVRPEVALISTGSDNNYGHPRKSVIEHLKSSNPDIKIYQTEEGDRTSKYKDLVSTEGLVANNIVVSTDGGCLYAIQGSGAEFTGKIEMRNDDC